MVISARMGVALLIVKNNLYFQSFVVMMRVRLCIWAEYVYLGKHEFCRRINFAMEDETRDSWRGKSSAPSVSFSAGDVHCENV